MAHSLILGMTESGKTTLARKLAAYYKAQGIGVIVLDPLKDPLWQCDFITADQDEFLEVFWNSQSCMVFLDEGAESVGRYDKAMRKTATQGRHWGHCCHFITQHGTDLSPVVRGQCRHLFLFASARQQGEVLAKEYNQPELISCTDLKQGEYLHFSRFGVLKRCRLFSNNGGNENDTAPSDSGRRSDGIRTAGGDSTEEISQQSSAGPDAASAIAVPKTE